MAPPGREGGPTTLRSGSGAAAGGRGEAAAWRLASAVDTDRYARLPAAPSPVSERSAEPIFDAFAALSDRAPLAEAAIAAEEPPGDEIPPTVRTPRWGAAVAPAGEGDAAAPTGVLQVAVVPAAADEGPEQFGPQDISGFDSFFKAESFPPVVETVVEPEAEAAELDEPSPELLARRSRLRKAVGGAVAVLALGLVAMLGQGPIARSVAAASPHLSAPATSPVEAAAALAAPIQAPRSIPVALARPGGKATAPAAGSTAPATEAGATRMQEARVETVRLLSRRELERAAAEARKLIAADPEDAFGYLCLGAALQDQGKVAQARDAYVTCHRRASRGNRAECGALLNGGQ